ncbi:MAG: monovalent cation/H(+) antiporter subunit G [Candidatus Margulisbacteria bacterium]|jgi:multicomponent Na+:H+ antiporter subunit G|nr:monovalent cation/H(+) antiporter subunit G [Candidatus Margulisiibacteriota bacterium]|tara:strand:- start:159 stop:569 length:411 start_codon:yes stop_codon:yes gene_type:complete
MAINVLAVILFAIISQTIHHPTVQLILNILIMASLGLGLFFFFATSVGVLRFPDFFTRLHAAGKGDTLSTILILLACSLFSLKSAKTLDQTTILAAIKILLIINFIFIGSPTATHALIEAGYNSEIDPWENNATRN